MATEHDSILDPEIHEPKGVAAASSNTLYLADGAGSGAWEFANPHGGLYYTDIGTGTTITTPTAFTLIDPSTTATHLDQFTQNSLGRLTYTGTPSRHLHAVTDLSFKHSTGSGQDVYFSCFKNGVEVTGSTVVQTADSANFQHIAFHFDGQAVADDYYETYVKTASGSVIIHKFYMFLMGMPD